MYRGNVSTPPGLMRTKATTYAELVERIERRKKITGLTMKELLRTIRLTQNSFYSWRAKKACAVPTNSQAKELFDRVEEATKRW